MQTNTTTNKSTSASTSFDPWLLWIAFRKHWGWCIPLGALLASLSGLGLWYTFEPIYEATFVLEANQDYVLSKAFSDQRGDLARSEKQLISNAVVLDPVLSDEKLKDAFSYEDPLQPERQLRKNLSVGNAGTDNLLTISYKHRNPEMAAKVCNAIAASYIDIRRQRDDDRMKNVESWLKGPLDFWKREVEGLRLNLAELSKATNGYDPFKPTTTLESDSSRLAKARNEIAALTAEEIALDARLEVLESRGMEGAESPAPQFDLLELQRVVDADPEVKKLREKLADLETKIRTMEFKEQQDLWAARYRSMKSDAAKTEAELKDVVAKATTAAEEMLIEMSLKQAEASRQRTIDQLRFDLTNLRAKKSAFQADYEEERSIQEKMGGETAELFFAREDYEQAKAILSQLNERMAVMRTERGRGSSVNAFAEARVPPWPMEEVPIKKIGMAAGASFFLPFALAVLLEFRLKRITSADSLDSQHLAPVVGEIARVPGGAKSTRGHRLFEESIDALRANLLFKLADVRTIVVTSAMSSEGKSSVASQLAISLARASETTVLLIDADLRSPDQHDLFGLPMGKGLSAYLTGKAELGDCINTSLGDFVHVLTAGRLSANPHNLLNAKNIERLLEKVCAKYRFVVIDTAPVLPAHETMAVAAAADATLLCAMRDVSRTDHVHRTHRRLSAAGAKIIGTVFSGVPSHEYAYRYGDYRYANRIE